MKKARTSFNSLVCLLIITMVPAIQAQAPVREADSEVLRRLARIEQLLNNQGLLDMLQQLESLQREMNQLRGEVEIQNRNIEELRRRQRALYTDLDQRLQGMERGSPAELSTLSMDPGGTADENPPLQTLSPVFDESNTATTQPGENPLNVETLSTTIQTQQEPGIIQDLQPGVQPANNPQAMLSPAGNDSGFDQAAIDPVQVQADYQTAFDLLKGSQYEMAIQSFRAFLTNYPESNYSDNAQYWLGEAFYVMRRFEQALEEYNTLVTNYPQSQKYTHALLKIGYSYHELGQIDKAREYLQSLLQKYPGTTASRLAEERLKKIALSEQQTTVTEPPMQQ